MKLKESIKTIILTMLVISSLVLSFNIWFSEGLWSYGYNSFSYAKGGFLSGFFSVFRGKGSYVLDIGQIFSPKQILINESEKSLLVSTFSHEYENLNNILKDYMKDAFSKGKFSETTDEEYQKMCKASSLFADFYTPVSFDLIYDYYNIEHDSHVDDMENIKHILLAFSGESSVSLYAKNSKTEKIYKTTITEEHKVHKEHIAGLLKKVKENNITVSFAFENNFDKKAEGEENKLLLNSYMLINLEQLSANRIVAENMSNSFLSSDNTDKYSSILSKFNVSVTSSRRFTDTKGTINFVENYGTLKFFKNGLLKYNSAGDDKGVKLENVVSTDYDAIKSAGEFVDNLSSFYKLPDNNSYVFSGVSKNNENKSYMVYFDVLYSGIPVIPEYKLPDGETLNHAIEVEIKNDNIISYKHLFCGFNKKGDKYEIPPMILALDNFYTVYDVEKNKGVKINDMYNIYHFNIEKDVVNLKCAVSLSDNKTVFVDIIK